MIIDPRLYKQVEGHPYPLLFATISGAHLYGFPSPDSDYDLRGAHLLPLRVERPALRRLPAKQEKSRALATGLLRLSRQPIEVELLLIGGVFEALELVNTRGFGGAAIDHGQL